MAFPNVGQGVASTAVGILPKKPALRLPAVKKAGMGMKPQASRNALVAGMKGC